jgi:hypothetical protein
MKFVCAHILTSSFSITTSDSLIAYRDRKVREAVQAGHPILFASEAVNS